MKNIIFIFFLISFEAAALVSVDDCMKDAQLYGNHKRAVSPLEECQELIDKHADKIEVTSTDKKFRLFGLGNMLYVQGPEEVSLLAGDQTRLKFINKIWVDEVNRRIFVLQSQELLTFNLDFIGNVNPLKMTSSPLFVGLKDLKFNAAQNLLSLSFEDGSQKRINADAESRDLSAKKPLIVLP